MELAVLGPLTLIGSGAPIALGPPRQRAVLAALALAEGRPVSADALIDRVWGERPPVTAMATLHSYVGKLRRALDEDGHGH